jgi:hypothetical protein
MAFGAQHMVRRYVAPVVSKVPDTLKSGPAIRGAYESVRKNERDRTWCMYLSLVYSLSSLMF